MRPPLEGYLSVRKRYCVLGLRLWLGLGLGLAKLCFQSNVFSSKCCTTL